MEIAAVEGRGGCGSDDGGQWHLASGFMGTKNPWRGNPGPGEYAKMYKYIDDGSMDGVPPKSGWFGTTAREGSVHCLYYELSPQKINENTAAQMASWHQTDLQDFYAINPELKMNWKNMLPMTRYCVSGFIEPKRAWNGKCGPNHQNATCHGTKKTCCNSETWTCGNTIDDCAPGVCYEGTCHGHSIFSTDGLCGAQHGFRGCAGKWGNCCSAEGKCGSGPDFCGVGCQLGRCDEKPPSRAAKDENGEVNFSWDSCGGSSRLVCQGNHGGGACCSKDGRCSSRVKDCGAGCQPEYGKCGAEAFWVPAPYLERFSTDILDEVSRLETSASQESSDDTLSHEEL